VAINGTTQDFIGRFKNCKCTDESVRLGEPGLNSQRDEFYSVGFIESDRTREDSFGPNINRDTPTGKILQRLELIEKAYLESIHSDKNRLEARLEEKRREEESFKEALIELKQEIHKLATEAEIDSNGNGHKS
jgi:hypothetical protein